MPLTLDNLSSERAFPCTRQKIEETLALDSLHSLEVSNLIKILSIMHPDAIT